VLSAQGFRAVSKTGRAKNSARHRSSNRLWLIAPVLSRGVRYVSMNGCKPDTCILVYSTPHQANGSKPARPGYRANRSLHRAEFFALPLSH
jgi:hypothetical protein